MNDLNVSKASWHYKIYQWAVDFWFDFMDRGYWHESDRARLKRVSNLCFYMRVIIVWVPLVVLLHLSVLVSGWVTFVTIPNALFGPAWGEFVKFVLLILGCMSICVAMLFLVFRAFPSPKEWFLRATRPSREGARKALTPARKAATSFFGLLWKFLVANKKKICPTINPVNRS